MTDSDLTKYDWRRRLGDGGSGVYSPEIVLQPQSLGPLEQVTWDGGGCGYCADVQSKTWQIQQRYGKSKLTSFSSHHLQAQLQVSTGYRPDNPRWPIKIKNGDSVRSAIWQKASRKLL